MKTIKNNYIAAFRKLGITGLQFQDSAVGATIKGQCKMYHYYNSARGKKKPGS